MAVKHVVIYIQGAHRLADGLTADRLADGLSNRLSMALRMAFQPNADVEHLCFEGVNIASRSIEKQVGDARQAAIRVLDADYYDLFLESELTPAVQRAWANFVAAASNIGLAHMPARRLRDHRRDEQRAYDPFRQVWHAGYHTRQRTITERYDHKRDEFPGYALSGVRDVAGSSAPLERMAPAAAKNQHPTDVSRLQRAYIGLVAMINLVVPLVLFGLIGWWLYEIAAAMATAAMALGNSGAAIAPSSPHGFILPVLIWHCWANRPGCRCPGAVAARLAAGVAEHHCDVCPRSDLPAALF